MRAVLSFACVALVACGNRVMDNPTPIVDPVESEATSSGDSSPASYVQEFYSCAKAFNIAHLTEMMKSVNVVADTLYTGTTGDSVGICHYYTTKDGRGVVGQSSIEFRKSFWTRASDIQKRDLVFHEMGHCVLGLDHVTDRDDVMNQEMPSDTIIIATINSFKSNMTAAWRPRFWTEVYTPRFDLSDEGFIEKMNRRASESH